MTSSNLLERIDRLVAQHREDIVAALSTILKFRTVSGGSTDEDEQLYRSETERCLKWLESEANRMGLAWRNHDNQVAVIQLGEHDRFIGLPVHTDVVPVGEGWKHDPFGGIVEDGTIWGRGCQDDKGPVIQTLYAVYLLKELGLPLKRGARLIIGTKEETGPWDDIRHYFTVEPEPEYCIVSDAGFPVINGEKGMLNVSVTATIPADELPTTGGLWLRSARAGQRANIVPERAEVRFGCAVGADTAGLERELDRFLAGNSSAHATLGLPSEEQGEIVIVFHGKSAHGSTPAEGHNAALDMLQFISESAFVTDDEADLAGFLFESCADLTGACLGIAAHHPFIGETTVNLGILEWEAGRLRAVLNIRHTMGQRIDGVAGRIAAKVAAFAEETGFEAKSAVEGRALDPIFLDPTEHPSFIAALMEAYQAVTGREGRLLSIGGTTYAKAFPRAVCFGPVDEADGEVELAHQVDERVSIEHHLRNVRIYAYALARLCAD
ncbi:MAG: Sapep family Mn(2+)-dependent dipeptidase [Candidatus Sumerlaeaceae bacterium]|nr:Sapep family Mn(2+)-dependent dipeptidase [Candidatus Sumerlaeaceae bacterium]